MAEENHNLHSYQSINYLGDICNLLSTIKMAQSTTISTPIITDDNVLSNTSAVARIQHIQDLNRKFRAACSQLILINNLMDQMDERYNRASINGQKSFKYLLRLRICTLEGVRSAFYDYATHKADELEFLQRTLFVHTGINWSRELEDESFDLNDLDLISDPEIRDEHLEVNDFTEVSDLEDESDYHSDTSYQSDSELENDLDLDSDLESDISFASLQTHADEEDMDVSS